MDEVRDYFDAVKPGMRDILVRAEKEKDGTTVDINWAKNIDLDLGNEATNMWRALKKMTDDSTEARSVVTSVPGEDGYAAWAKLHRRFGMALSMKQGTMPASFSNLGTQRMKSPAETRSRVIQVDNMAKLTQEVTGMPVGDDH